MDFIEQNEQLHFQIKVDAENEFVQGIRTHSDVQKATKTHNVDFGKGIINLYQGLPGFNLMFPIPFTNSYLLVYFDEKAQFDNVKVMKLQTNDTKLEISFTNVNTEEEVKGIFQDGEYVRTELVNQSGEISIQSSFMQCVEDGFNRLPLAMKIFCSAACAAIWTLPGSAACAGCIAGAGITC